MAQLGQCRLFQPTTTTHGPRIRNVRETKWHQPTNQPTNRLGNVEGKLTHPPLFAATPLIRGEEEKKTDGIGIGSRGVVFRVSPPGVWVTTTRAGHTKTRWDRRRTSPGVVWRGRASCLLLCMELTGWLVCWWWGGGEVVWSGKGSQRGKGGRFRHISSFTPSLTPRGWGWGLACCLFSCCWCCWAVTLDLPSHLSLSSSPPHLIPSHSIRRWLVCQNHFVCFRCQVISGKAGRCAVVWIVSCGFAGGGWGKRSKKGVCVVSHFPSFFPPRLPTCFCGGSTSRFFHDRFFVYYYYYYFFFIFMQIIDGGAMNQTELANLLRRKEEEEVGGWIAVLVMRQFRHTTQQQHGGAESTAVQPTDTNES